MKNSIFTKPEILKVYAEHPLREETILGRISENKGDVGRLTEWDLAVDNDTELTDQNHVGGVEFVRQLARAADITAKSNVLDLGCGLGGSARILALQFRCKVLGIDISPKRCREARRLTRRVGLEKNVKFRCLDFQTGPVPRGLFDVIWGQSAWVHVRDKRRFLQRWSCSLAPNGKIAVEDAFLFQPPTSSASSRKLNRLEWQWKSHLISLREWKALLEELSFEVVLFEEKTKQMTDYYKRLEKSSHMASASSAEAEAWRNALYLIQKRAIGYYRTVVKRR
jgi:cyclopropane fatty-acyl-phospholipid synthase-like methyltransferase